MTSFNLLYFIKYFMMYTSRKLIMLPIHVLTALIILTLLPVTYLYQFFASKARIAKSIVEGNIQFITQQSCIARIAQNLLSMLEGQRKRQAKILTPDILSPRSKQRHIEMIYESAELSPKKQTQNLKVLLLKQKMQELQEKVFQQSKLRCKVQKQIFDLNVQMVTKNAEFVNSRKENLLKMRELQMLQTELEQKEKELEYSDQMAQFLEHQFNQLKSRFESVRKKIQSPSKIKQSMY